MHVRSGFEGIPSESAYTGVLRQLLEESRDLRERLEAMLDDLETALNQVRATGTMMQSGGFFSDPIIKGLGLVMVEAADATQPTAREFTSSITTVFEGFEILLGGVGNPDKIAKISELLDAEVSAKLVSLSDAVSVSKLATNHGWDSPAASFYRERADRQSIDGIRPVAEAIAEASRALDAYAESQLEMADAISNIWIPLFLASVGWLFTIGGLVSWVHGAVIGGAAPQASTACQIIGSVSTIGGLLVTTGSTHVLRTQITDATDMAQAPCEALNQALITATASGDVQWPSFAREA